MIQQYTAKIQPLLVKISPMARIELPTVRIKPSMDCGTLPLRAIKDTTNGSITRIQPPMAKILPMAIIDIEKSEYDQEIPQSKTADKPMAPRGRVTQQSCDPRKTN